MGIPRGQRISYIDWMRGLACLLMFQTHCYDSWLSAAARRTEFFGWSQLVGTLPAPLFLFLAGISFALVTGRMRQKGIGAGQIARTTILRGAEILGLGLLFRVQEFALGYGYAPWTDLLRVDILNVIGISIMLMGVLCWVVRKQPANAVAAGIVAAGIAMMTPPLWTTLQPRWLPWPLESYVNGVHNLGAPQPWLFPIFPWTAFAFAGLAAGFFVLSDWARAREAKAVGILGAGGAILFFAGRWFDSLPVKMYAGYDFWHTSPNFFLMRVGAVMLIALAAYAWCKWGAGQWGFSPLITMGQASLVVYWVHIEFVYGRFSILVKHGESIAGASIGLLIIFAAMTMLAAARIYTKGRGAEVVRRLREKMRRGVARAADDSAAD
ncbi:MAG TPA: heparan-alpha-glucosaminide N-acetyltransferase domain-containing protein [Verrucomicrobiae bacterium]|nr:heparan-alpha-glucosaminide N-acetyltransferase domain-containing protein [Verrucomicrobiae bacterium]